MKSDSLELGVYFRIATIGIVPVLPGAGGGGRRDVFAPEPLLVIGTLPIIGRHQMGKVGVIDVPAMEFVGGWSLEGIGRSLVDESSQELSLVIGQ